MNKPRWLILFIFSNTFTVGCLLVPFFGFWLLLSPCLCLCQQQQLNNRTARKTRKKKKTEQDSKRDDYDDRNSIPNKIKSYEIYRKVDLLDYKAGTIQQEEKNNNKHNNKQTKPSNHDRNRNPQHT